MLWFLMSSLTDQGKIFSNNHGNGPKSPSFTFKKVSLPGNLSLELCIMCLQGCDKVPHLLVNGPGLLVGRQVLLKLYPQHFILLPHLQEAGLVRIEAFCS